MLPLLTSKILGIRAILMATGSARMSYKSLGEARFNLESRIISILERLCYSMCDSLIVESPSMVDFLGISKYCDKIAVASLGVEDSFKEEVVYSERENIIGYVGRLNREKGVLNLIESVPILKNTNYEFILVGDGAEKDRIIEFIEEYHLQDRITLLGFVDRARMVELMNSFRMLIIPSYTEGLPNVLLEAMACGTPVAATAVGGIPDVIDDGRNGYLMRDNNPNTIATSIDRFISNQNKGDLSKCAINSIKQNYSMDIVMRKWELVMSKEKI